MAALVGATDHVLAMRDPSRVWIRSMRWVAADGENSFRGSYMPASGSEDIDTSILNPESFGALFPATGSALAAFGRLIVEFVVEDEAAPDELGDWLARCSPIDATQVSSYVMLKNPFPTMYFAETEKARVDGEEKIRIKEEASASLRGFDVVEVDFEARDLRHPVIVGRQIRALYNEFVLLVFWRRRWAFPHMPEPRGEYAGPASYEFPGVVIGPTDVSDALARGVPEDVARFPVEWGGVGPREFDAAMAGFDEDPAIGPSAVGEAVLASAVRKMRSDVDSLAVAHDQMGSRPTRPASYGTRRQQRGRAPSRTARRNRRFGARFDS